MGPVLRGLAQEKITYRGLLYPGLMITDDRPRVQGIADANARLIAADGIAPHREAGRRRDVDARRPGLQWRATRQRGCQHP